MAQRLKKKKPVKRPKRVARAKKAVATQGRAKMKESKEPLTTLPGEACELTGKRCPQGCCLDIRISTEDGRILGTIEVLNGLDAFGQILSKHGLPPLALATPQGQVNH